MSFGQFREIRLRDFRCFRERQIARLAPLTLLVGENSTGKTSFNNADQRIILPILRTSSRWRWGRPAPTTTGPSVARG